MRLTTILTFAAVGLTLAAPTALAAQQTTRIGTGSKTCTVKIGASCKGVKHVHVDLHGKNLRGAHFEKADLRKADFSFADLRGAHFEGANLRGVDFSGAKLKGANFGPVKRSGKVARQAQPAPSCSPSCSGANLTGANFSYADLSSATLTSANLDSADLTFANLTSANLTYANLTSTNLYETALDSANLTSANFTMATSLNTANTANAQWLYTVCPNGDVAGTSCSPS